MLKKSKGHNEKQKVQQYGNDSKKIWGVVSKTNKKETLTIYYIRKLISMLMIKRQLRNILIKFFNDIDHKIVHNVEKT